MNLRIFSNNPILNVIGVSIMIVIVLVVVVTINNNNETKKIILLRDAMQEAYDANDLDLSQVVSCAMSFSPVDQDIESILVPKYLNEMPVYKFENDQTSSGYLICEDILDNVALFREGETISGAYQGFRIQLTPESYPLNK